MQQLSGDRCLAGGYVMRLWAENQWTVDTNVTVILQVNDQYDWSKKRF